ncbi:MAG: FliM/FliN family flagellar motor switch protein [Sulfitobacter sp.]
MTETPDNLILQRKAQAGTRDHQSRTMSVPKALRLSVAKVANDLFSMALSVIGATKVLTSAADCAAEFDDDSLLVLLDGPEQASGAAVISPSLVTALIQHQLMGKVSDAPGNPRKMTTTDAALCAPLLDRVLERATHLLETDADRRVLSGFRFGARTENARLLQMALNDAEYNVIRLTLDIASGAQQGTLTLVLPVGAARDGHETQSADEKPQQSGQQTTLNDTVMALHADLTAVLCCIPVTVSQLGQLKVGDTLDVPNGAFEKAQITTAKGVTLATGMLGQRGGLRAIRMTHQTHASGTIPQRRASDRQELDMQIGDTRFAGVADAGQAPAGDHQKDPTADLPRLEDLPDALSGGGLPDFSDLPEPSGQPVEGGGSNAAVA